MAQRRTVVVSSELQRDEVLRRHAAAATGLGLQTMSMPALAARLAGGFSAPIDAAARGRVLRLGMAGLDDADLGDLAPLKSLPGFPGSVMASIERLWANGCRPREAVALHPRLRALGAVETAVHGLLPANQMSPPDLVDRAIAAVKNAPKVLGPVTIAGAVDLDPVWRPLVAALAAHVTVRWEGGTLPVPAWVATIPGVTVVPGTPVAVAATHVRCADARAEIVEALRWARALMASGQARPDQIAIAAMVPATHDDPMAGLAASAAFAIHFAQGRPALHGASGQACAALADVLLRGATRERVRRLVGLAARERRELAAIEPTWWSSIKGDGALMTLSAWQTAIEGDHAAEVRQHVLPLVERLMTGIVEAEALGEAFLGGLARTLWRRALAQAPAAALEATLAELRVPDGTDPASAVLWAPASVLVACPRPFVRLVGLNAKLWPRPSYEDPILPEHVLATLPPHADGRPLVERVDRVGLDRLLFEAIAAGADGALVCSRADRDAKGSRLPPSRLTHEDATIVLRTRIPSHAMSEPDRRLARPPEFAGTPLARQASACWIARRSVVLTAHDGLVRANHPLLLSTLSLVQSASSLTLLLRNPMGFAFKYAYGLKAPEYDTEPLELNPIMRGVLVHDIIEEATRALIAAADRGILAVATASTIETAVADAVPVVEANWRVRYPLPPDLVWSQERAAAAAKALNGLLEPLDALTGQESWTELVFGDALAAAVDADEDDEDGVGPSPAVTGPWPAGRSVAIPGTTLSIRGKIDRLDLSGDRSRARVLDYKTGAIAPKEQLKGGREVQRCLYRVAVSALVPSATDPDAALLHVGTPGGVARLEDPAAAEALLVDALVAATRNLADGLMLPGPPAGERGDGGGKRGNQAYERDPFAFVMPSLPDFHFEIKRAAAADRLGPAIAGFWEVT